MQRRQQKREALDRQPCCARLPIQVSRTTHVGITHALSHIERIRAQKPARFLRVPAGGCSCDVLQVRERAIPGIAWHIIAFGFRAREAVGDMNGQKGPRLVALAPEREPPVPMLPRREPARGRGRLGARAPSQEATPLNRMQESTSPRARRKIDGRFRAAGTSDGPPVEWNSRMAGRDRANGILARIGSTRGSAVLRPVVVPGSLA